MNEHSSQPAKPAIPVPPVLPDEPFPCAMCGYDLRTLRVAGKCPECGLHIAKSLRSGVVLSLADWMTLRSSTTILLAANIGALLAAGAFIGRGVFGLGTWGLDVGSAALLGYVACAPVALVGYRRIARVHDHSDRRADSFQPASVLRATAFARTLLVVFLAGLYLFAGMPSRGGIAAWAQAILGCGVVLYVLLTLLHFLAMMVLLELIALRSRHRTLAGSCSALSAAAMAAAFPGSLLFGLGVPVAWVLYLVMLDCVRRVSRQRVEEYAWPSPDASSPPA